MTQPNTPQADLFNPKNHLSLKQLAYLVAVADSLSFTRAAQRCFVSQSTLSGGLKDLETTLKVNLVERTRKRVWLSSAGLELVERARQLLGASADLVAWAGQRQMPLTGTVRLGAIPTIAPFVLPLWMPQLRQHAPKLQVLLSEATTAELLGALRSGKLDIAVLALPIDTGELEVHTLFSEELVLVCSAEDVLAASETLALSQLPNQRLILLAEGHCLREHSLAACRSLKAFEASTIEATSLTTLLAMVEAGLGVALLPQMAITHGLSERYRLSHRRLDPSPERDIALVMRPTHHLHQLIALMRQLQIVSTEKPA